MQKAKFIAIDLLIVGFAAVAAFVLRHFSLDAVTLRDAVWLHAAVSVAAAALCIVFSGMHRAVWRYFSFADALRLVGVVTVALLIAWFVMFTATRADEVPRAVPFIQWFLTIGLMGLARTGVRTLRGTSRARRQPTSVQPHEHVIVVGLNHVTELYLKCVTQLASDRIAVVGILHDDPAMHGRSLNFSKVIGQTRNIAHVLTQYRIHGIEIDRIVVAEPFDELDEDARKALIAIEKSEGIVLDCFEEQLDLALGANAGKRTVPEASPARARDDLYDALGTTSRAAASDIPLGYRIAKRSFDIAGALGLLILTLPLVVVTAFVVALDVGPPLTFWQVRPGRFGAQFKLLKFRTMRPGHDAQGKRIPDERRMSALGRTLRRTRMDELPQLLNILKGDMSFVGPRPLLPVDQPRHADVRLSVKPGLTGWAQINGGHSLLPKEDKGAMDIWYVRNGTFWLDMRILFRTVIFVIRGERPPSPKALAAARREVEVLSRAARADETPKPSSQDREPPLPVTGVGSMA